MIKKIYFTVGPSEIYPTVPHHLEQAIQQQVLSMSHRGKEFSVLYQQTEVLLKKLLSIPDEYAVFFLGSSIEAMERIIENTVEKTSLHFVDGAFSQKAAGIAKELGKDVVKIPAPESSVYDFSEVSIPENAEIIFITENDTSTGLIFPHDEIYALKKKYPEKLIAVDLVSSAPYSAIDFSKIDMAFFSGQKGFGIPAGMSVLVVSPRAIKKAEELREKDIVIGTYHNFLTLQKSRENWQTPETPNVLNIYLLQHVLEDLEKEGIANIRASINRKAAMMYDFFDGNEIFEPYVRDPIYRSPSTLVIKVKGGSSTLRQRLAKEGVVVGGGYGKHKDEHIRIANFPAHTILQIEKLLDLLGRS